MKAAIAIVRRPETRTRPTKLPPVSGDRQPPTAVWAAAGHGRRRRSARRAGADGPRGGSFGRTGIPGRVSHVTDGQYEVLDPTPGAMPPTRRRPARWLVRNRFVLVLLAILIVVIGREVLTRNREVPGASSGPLTAVVRGLDWNPTSAFPRLVEVELTNIGNRSIAATRLQLHGDGVPPGDVEELNRVLGQGDRAPVKFGMGDPYCVTAATARLDGTVFDIAGAAGTVALDVKDPDGMLERVNDLACFGGAQPVTGEINADALLA